METFLWVLLALIPVISWFIPVKNAISPILVSLSPAFTDIVLLMIAIKMIGNEAWLAICRSIRWPGVQLLSLAIAFPCGVFALISTSQFLLQLFKWSIHRSDGLGVLQISSYFMLPKIGLLLFIPLAFCEELVFRALLQPRFVARYGIFRGIFLVGVVFAFAHVSTDFSAWYSDALVVVKLALRLCESMAISFVTGWLTLRTGSVFPAAVAHGLLNVLGVSPFGPQFLMIGPLISLLLAILACTLFLYWPVQTHSERN